MNNNNNNNKIDLKRDSFSDRICDDLCQVLLSYLSFDDKIRFECVSKQFERCVFVKQDTIVVEEYPSDKKNTLNNLFNLMRRNEDFKAFESVLKKCQFINKVIIDSNSVQVFKLIIKYCNNLSSIAFNFNQINDQLIEEFGRKFGQKLRKIGFIRAYDVIESNDNITKYKKLLRLCPNLIALGNGYVTYLSLFIDKNELLIPKLSKVAIRLLSEDFQLIETFAKNYGNSLKSITFENCFWGDNIEANILMKQIIHLKNLTKLDLTLRPNANSSKEFVENFKAIAIHCKKLKRFYLFIAKSNPLLNKQIFNCFRLFKNLKFMNLCLCEDNQLQSNQESNEESYEESNQFSCELLKELKLLMNLILESPKMNDNFFENIDKHLPQIKHLVITVDNFMITDKAMDSLSKLSKLQSIKIRCPEDIYEETYDILPLITDIGLLNVINNCPKINSIEFYGRPNISHKTIDALIALALRKPNIYFKHRFYDIDKSCSYDSAEDIVFNVIKLKSYQLPNNLVIK
jgi:hypothetical protein